MRARQGPSPRGSPNEASCIAFLTGVTQKLLKPPSFLFRQLRLRLTVAAAYDVHQNEQPEHEKQEWTEPQQIGDALERRAIEHEITVACDQEVDDLLVVLALLHHAVDFAPQVMGERRIGVGERLIL